MKNVDKKRFMADALYRTNVLYEVGRSINGFYNLYPEHRGDLARSNNNLSYTIRRRGLNPQFIRMKTIVNFMVRNLDKKSY